MTGVGRPTNDSRIKELEDKVKLVESQSLNLLASVRKLREDVVNLERNMTTAKGSLATTDALVRDVKAKFVLRFPGDFAKICPWCRKRVLTRAEVCPNCEKRIDPC